MFPMNLTLTERDVVSPCFSFDGKMILGSMVLRITKRGIYVFLPEGAHGMRLLPTIGFLGYCPVCQGETMAAHMIVIEGEVQKQINICTNCETEFRPNPEIFPQAIVMYDDRLDENFFTNLPLEYLKTCREIIKQKEKEDHEDR